MLNRIVFSVFALLVAAGCQTVEVESPSNRTVEGDTVGSSVILGERLPVGMVLPYAADVTPETGAALASQGWLFCDGSAVAVLEYADLYQVIGNTHGEGDRPNTFRLPDYRGLFLRGVSGSSGRDPDADERSAAGPGGRSGNAVGSVQADSTGLHEHRETGVADLDGANLVVGSTNPQPGMKEVETTAVAGASDRETRPANAGVHYLIFAGIPSAPAEVD